MKQAGNKAITFRYSLLTVLFIGLCYLFPYTGDDWAWGSEIGLQRLSTWFDNYSGRYLGNLIVLLLTRNRFLRAVVMALVFSGIVYCIERIMHRQWAFYFAVMCLLFVPKTIFRQAIVWTSGFSNYATSIFLILTFMCYLFEHISPSTEKKPGPLCLAGLLLLGFSNSLIVEHLTVFSILLSIVILIWWITKYKTLPLDYTMYAIGAFLGGWMMFSNSVYHSINQGLDGYRKIAQDGLFSRIIQNYFPEIYKDGFFNNVFINTVILAVCIFLFKRFFITSRRTSLKMLSTICISVMSVFWFYSVASCLFSGSRTQTFRIVLFEGILTGLDVLATICLSILITPSKKTRHLLAMLWTFAILMVGPLFVVTPIGSRCFLASYLILSLIACVLIETLNRCSNINYPVHFVYSSCIIAVATVFVFYYYIFAQVYTVDQERLNAIRNAVDQGASSEQLAHLPHEDYLWTSYPYQDNDIWEQRYKLFYEIPDSFDLVLER